MSVIPAALILYTHPPTHQHPSTIHPDTRTHLAQRKPIRQTIRPGRPDPHAGRIHAMGLKDRLRLTRRARRVLEARPGRFGDGDAGDIGAFVCESRDGGEQEEEEEGGEDEHGWVGDRIGRELLLFSSSGRGGKGFKPRLYLSTVRQRTYAGLLSFQGELIEQIYLVLLTGKALHGPRPR